VAYQVLIKQSAERELDVLPAKMRDRVANRLLALEKNPRPVGVKKLHGQERYRLRVGDYRILFTLDDTNRTVTIYTIGHRREVCCWAPLYTIWNPFGPDAAFSLWRSALPPPLTTRGKNNLRVNEKCSGGIGKPLESGGIARRRT
jgi:mRNA interferase RelE/StbE